MWEPCKREETDDGPDYCGPCSEKLQGWVQWDSHRHLVNEVLYLRQKLESVRSAIKALSEL